MALPQKLGDHDEINVVRAGNVATLALGAHIHGVHQFRCHLHLDFQHLFHVDAYRLNSGKELKQLGIEEIIADSQNIVLIEWAERVADILPQDYVRVHMDHVAEKERKVTISNSK